MMMSKIYPKEYKHGRQQRGQSKAIDAYYSAELLSAVLRLFSLHAIQRSGGMLRRSWSRVNAAAQLTVLGSLCIALFGYILKCGYDDKIEPIGMITQSIVIMGLLQQVIDYTSIYRETGACIKFYEKLNELDMVLGVIPYFDVRRKILGLVLGVLSSATGCAALEYFLWIAAEASWMARMSFIESVYFVLRALTFLDVMAQCVQLESRMRALAAALEPSRARVPLAALHRCYLLILDQTDFINDSYGLRILLVTIYFTMKSVILFHTVITMSQEKDLPLGFKIAIAGGCSRFLFCSCIFFLLVYRCEQCYRQGERVLTALDDNLVINHHSYDQRSLLSLKKLRKVMMTRPVHISLANFFKLEYGLVMGFVSILVSYTIIMIQQLGMEVDESEK